MSDLTVADELEFESWPEEKRELAIRYVREKIVEGDYHDGWDRGYDVGYKAGIRQAHGDKS